ncbi:MAG: transketolase [Bacilli bacterium]|nr:transketolase [Bacilli bacterium]MDD4282639.1 transketolase [Bacilli bacterium]MDD4719076.1 transketolase [Bacilli bacterium]
MKETKTPKPNVDQMTINYIKALAIDMINEAGSGHPGIVLGAAPALYTLYKNHLNFSTVDPNWINRDRFVMSAGHGSALLYAMLYVAGFHITLDDLKNFRRASFPTPGHPEYGVTSGVDMSTGPLGQGLASAVGMALGGKINSEKYILSKNNKNKSIIDYKVYVLCSDGDLMEGVAQEAASLAGNLSLNNLIVLYDSNDISLDGPTVNTFNENILNRFKSMGWNTEFVKNGDNINAINRAINKAKTSSKPTIIEIKTIIGKDTTLAGTHEVHGKVLGKDETLRLKQSLGLPENTFYVSEDIIKNFKKVISERYQKHFYAWDDQYKEYVEKNYNGDYNLFNNMINSRFNINIKDMNWNFSVDEKEAIRDTNGKIMLKLAEFIPTFIGGSADLASSTKTYLHKQPDIVKNKYNGRNIWFGVREHGMGAMLNGLALSGFRPFGSTFLTFADYQKPAIRLSALMDLPVTYIYSHDSINIGQDGPTHQPIEQLAMLRSIPNMNVYRPADAHELVGCWHEILNNRKPSCLVVSRNPVELLKTTKAEEVKNGAYLVLGNPIKMDAVIIATGSEVSTAIYISIDLYKEFGIECNVVSMPSMELFLNQPKEYQEKIIPKTVKRIVIEAGSSFGWHQFVDNNDYLITIDKFGISGTKDEVQNYCDFSYEKIKNKIIDLLDFIKE